MTTLKGMAKAKLGTVRVLKRKDLTPDLMLMWVERPAGYLHRGGKGHHFHVLEGASYMNEFAYDGEFSRLAKEHPKLITFVPTVSRPDEAANKGWTGQKGRVNSIVEDYIAQKRLTPKDTMVYTCGHPGMIEDVKEHMMAAGFVFKEERFWKED